MSGLLDSDCRLPLQHMAGGPGARPAATQEPKSNPNVIGSEATSELAVNALSKLRRKHVAAADEAEQQCPIYTIPRARTTPHELALSRAQPLAFTASNMNSTYECLQSSLEPGEQRLGLPRKTQAEASALDQGPAANESDSPIDSCYDNFESMQMPSSISQQQAVKRSTARTRMMSDLQKQYGLAQRQYIQLKQSAAAAKRSNSYNGARISPLKAHTPHIKPQTCRSKQYRLLHGIQNMQHAPDFAQRNLTQQQKILEQEEMQQQQQQLLPGASQPLPALTIVVNMLLNTTAANASPAAAVHLKQQLLEQIKAQAAVAQQQQQPFSVAAALRVAIPQLAEAVKEICTVAQQQQQQQQSVAELRVQSSPAAASQFCAPAAFQSQQQQQQQQSIAELRALSCPAAASQFCAPAAYRCQQQQKQHNLPHPAATKLQAEQLQVRDKLMKWRQQQQNLQPLMPQALPKQQQQQQQRLSLCHEPGDNRPQQQQQQQWHPWGAIDSALLQVLPEDSSSSMAESSIADDASTSCADSADTPTSAAAAAAGADHMLMHHPGGAAAVEAALITAACELQMEGLHLSGPSPVTAAAAAAGHLYAVHSAIQAAQQQKQQQQQQLMTMMTSHLQLMLQQELAAELAERWWQQQ